MTILEEIFPYPTQLALWGKEGNPFRTTLGSDIDVDCEPKLNMVEFRRGEKNEGQFSLS